MEYLSFDLRLDDWDPLTKTGEGEVLYSPAGEGRRYRFHLDLDIDAISGRTHRTRQQAQELGHALFGALFTEASLSLWRESYQIARERGRGLRLRLQVIPFDLSRLPWELLFDPRSREFLVFDPRTSVVRYIRMGACPPVLRDTETLTVLAVVASPQDAAQLDCACELFMLHQALSDLVDEGGLRLVVCENATRETLYTHLLEHRPDVVHLIGHGEYDREARAGYFILEDEDGRAERLDATDTARLLRRYGTNLVVLNACETASGAWAGLAPSLVRSEVAAVVAMQWPVEDRAAVRFTHGFYRALAQGGSVDECMAEGRMAASATSNDPDDWAAPVLFLRSLSGYLWTSGGRGYLHGQRTGPVALQDSVSSTPGPQALSVDSSGLFKTRGPLQPTKDTALIIDRPALQRALRIARQPSVTQYVAILSARQTGKTTMLLRLKDLLQESYACVFVDLSVLSEQGAQDSFAYVAHRILSELGDLLGAKRDNLEALDVNGPVPFLQLLRAMAEPLLAERVIVFMDEVGALKPDVSNSLFSTLRTVFSEGRALHNALAKYLFFFSGAIDLYTLTSGQSSPLNICEKIYPSDLDLDDVDRIAQQFSRLGVPVDATVAERLYAHASGHPYLTVRLCAIMESCGLHEITGQDVDRAAEALLIEDDNIGHVIYQLEEHPIERLRLREIVVEGKALAFSRNDPVLASLEMIGAIRPTQPCRLRNRLYERALRPYLTRTTSPT